MAAKKKAKRRKKKRPTCFIATPIGDEDSSVRRDAEGAINGVIRPVLEDEGFRVIVPHEVPNPGRITEQFVQNLINDDLVVANLTTVNANVMYEVGVRHATGRPMVIVAEKGTVLPFDIKDFRTVFYSNDLGGHEPFQSAFRKTVRIALEEPADETPVFRAIREFVEEQRAKEGASDTENYLIEDIRWIRKHLEASQAMPQLKALDINDSAFKERLRRGSQEAWTDLVTARHGDLVKYAHMLGLDTAVAEDAVHEAWFQAFRRGRDITDDMSIEVWLRRFIRQYLLAQNLKRRKPPDEPTSPAS